MTEIFSKQKLNYNRSAIFCSDNVTQTAENQPFQPNVHGVRLTIVRPVLASQFGSDGYALITISNKNEAVLQCIHGSQRQDLCCH